MSDTEQAPSVPSTVPATDVIPGSEVQKATAISQATLPRPPSMDLPLGLKLQVLGAGLSGVATGVKSGKGDGTAGMLALADQYRARSAYGYMVGTQAAAMQNPALAGQAMQEMQQFLTDNAAALPVAAQQVGGEVIKTLKGIATQEMARGVLTNLARMPAGANRIEVFQTALHGLAQIPGMDPLAMVKAATEMGMLVPDTAARYETTIDQDRGIAYSRDKFTGKVSARRIEVEGGPGMELGPKITGFRPEVESEIELAGLDKGRLLGQLNSLDSEVRTAANATVQQLALIGRARSQQEKLTLEKDDVLLLPKIGVTRTITNMGQLTGQEKTRLLEARKQFNADTATNAAITRGLELGTEYAFTKTGEPISAGTSLEAIRAAGGVIRPASIAKDIMEVNKVLPQLDLMESLAKQAYGAYKLADKTGVVPSFERMIQLPVVRASMGQLAFNKLQAMSRLVNMEVVRGIIHNRVTNVELSGGEWLQPHDKDTIDLVLAKLEFLKFQGAVTKGGMLGQPAPNIEDAAIIGKFPHLLGKAADGQAAPTTFGNRPIRWR